MAGTRHPRLRRAGILLGAAGAFCGLIGAAAVAVLSVQYADSPTQVTTKLARYAVLSGVRAWVVATESDADVVSPWPGYVPVSWRATAQAPERFTATHPEVRFSGLPGAVPASPFAFHYGSHNETRAARLSEALDLPAFQTALTDRWRNLPAGDEWRQAFPGERVPDLYRFWELTNFVNQLWPHGDGEPEVDFTHFDTVRIVERARAGEAFYCHVYAMAWIELAQAWGEQARLLSLSADGIRRDHAVVEVWVDDMQRWVLFDPDFNLFYGSPVRPLHGVAVHRAYLTKTSPVPVFGRDPATVSYVERKDAIAAAYRNLDWHFRNDYWDNTYFPGHPNRSDFNNVMWDDGTRSEVLSLRPATHRLADVYGPVLRWGLEPERYDPVAGTVTVRLYVAYPDVAGVRMVGPDGEVPLTRDGDALWAQLPVAASKNPFTLQVGTHGGVPRTREFVVHLGTESHA